MTDTKCATEGCGNTASVHFERHGIGSNYCHDCYMKVQAITSRHQSAPDEGWVDRERYYKAIETLLDLVGPISGALTHDKRKEVKEIREWHEWDGLSCSCGGGWLVGHNSGCPEAALHPEPEQKP